MSSPTAEQTQTPLAVGPEPKAKEALAAPDLSAVNLFPAKPEEVKLQEPVGAGVTRADVVTDQARLRHDNLAAPAIGPTGGTTTAISTSVDPNRAHQELQDHVISLSVKKKTALDAELERFLQSHPGLAAQLQVQQAIEMLRAAQETQGKQAVSQHAFAAALDRIATNLKGDQLPIELVIPQSIADLYKLFEVAAEELKVDKDKARELVALSLFDPLTKALEANVKLLEARAARTLKRQRETNETAPKPAETTQTPAPVKDTYHQDKAAKAEQTLRDGGLAQLEAQKQRRYDEERVTLNKQLQELTEMAREIAKERARARIAIGSVALGEGEARLSTAVSAMERADAVKDPTIAAMLKETRDAFVKETMQRADLEYAARALYELTFKAEVLKGAGSANQAGEELAQFVRENAALLSRLPGGEQKLAEISRAAAEQADKSRRKLESAVTVISDTGWDSTIQAELNKLSSYEMIHLAALYRERTGEVLAQAIQSKMSGDEETQALRTASSGSRHVPAPESLQLAELSKIDPALFQARLQPRTDAETVAVIQDHLRAGRSAEAAITLRNSGFTLEQVEGIEKAHSLPSTIELVKRDVLLSQFVENRLAKGERLLPQDIAVIAEYDLKVNAAAIGVAKAALEANGEEIARQEQALSERIALLGRMDIQLRAPHFLGDAKREIESARQQTFLAQVAELSAQQAFLAKYTDDSHARGYKQARANQASNELNGYLARNAEYITSVPDLAHEVDKVRELGAAQARERFTEAQGIYNLINERKDEQLVAALRNELFERRNQHLIEDLKTLASLNRTTVEQLIESNLGIDSSRGKEALALLRGDRVDAAAVRLAQALQARDATDVAAIYSVVRRDGATAFEQLEKHFNKHYARTVTYQVYEQSYGEHGGHSRTVQCADLNDAVKQKLDQTKQLVVEAAKTGDQATLDAIALRTEFWGTFSYHPDGAVKHLSTFRTQLGELDLERIRACGAKFQELYRVSGSKTVNAMLSREGNDYDQLRALLAGNEVAFLTAQTLSKNYDQMLAAMEKSPQLIALEKIVANKEQLNGMFVDVTGPDGNVKSAEAQRQEFLDLVTTASKRWSDNRAALEARVQAKTGMSLAAFHEDALIPRTYDPETGQEIRLPPDALQRAILNGTRDGQGVVTDAMRLWRNMRGAGTTSEREITEIVRAAAMEGRFEQVDAELKKISGSSFREWIDDRSLFGVRELEGDDRFWVNYALLGPPKNAQEARARAQMVADYTESAGWVKNLPALSGKETTASFGDYVSTLTPMGAISNGGSLIASAMNPFVKDTAQEYADAKASVEKALSGYQPGQEMSADQRLALTRLEKASEAFLGRRNQIAEMVIDTGTMVVVVVGGTVIVVASGGLGAAAILTGVAGAARIGGKQVLMGGSYGWDSVAEDVGKTGVDFATLGISSKIPVGHFIQTRAATALGEAGLVAGSAVTKGGVAAVAVDGAGNVVSNAVTNATAAVATKGALEGTEMAAQQGVARVAGSALVDGGTAAVAVRGLPIGNGQGILSSSKMYLGNLSYTGRTSFEAVKDGVTGVGRFVGNPMPAVRSVAEIAENSVAGTVRALGRTGENLVHLRNPAIWLKEEGAAAITSIKALGQTAKPIVDFGGGIAARTGSLVGRGGAALGARAGRGAIGALGSSADGAIAAGIQGFGYTAISDQTWEDGIASGLGRSLKAGLHSAPMGALFGGAFGGLMHGAMTPRSIKLGQKLSLEATEAAMKHPGVNVEGRNLLNLRAEKGWLTRGDFYDAVAISKPTRNFAGRVERGFRAAEARIEAVQKSANADVAAAKATIDKPGVTPEQKAAAQATLERAQTRLTDLDPQVTELRAAQTEWSTSKTAPSRLQMEIFINGRPKPQSTVVTKEWLTERIAQETKVRDDLAARNALDPRTKARIESRLDGLNKMREVLDVQAEYLQARAKPFVEMAKSAKDLAADALTALKKQVARTAKPQEVPREVTVPQQADAPGPVKGDVPPEAGMSDGAGNAPVAPRPSGGSGSSGAALEIPTTTVRRHEGGSRARALQRQHDGHRQFEPVTEPVVEPVGSHSKPVEQLKPAPAAPEIAAPARPSASDEIAAQIKALKREPQTPEIKAELKKLYAEQIRLVREAAPVVEEGPIQSFRGDDGDTGGFGNDNTPDWFSGGGDGPSGGTAVAERSVATRSGSTRQSYETSSVSVKVNSLSVETTPGGGRVARESYNLEARSARAGQVDTDGPQMQLERIEAETSIGVLDETAPLVEEISIYDTPETRAWKESQRAELDQAIDDLFSASMDEFNLPRAKPSQGWENTQLRDIHQSAAKLGDDRLIEVRRVAKANAEVLIQEFELRAARTNEEIIHQRRQQEETSGRFERAKEAQEKSDALERAVDKPLDGVSDDVCVADKVFDETLKRICEPDHGNLTPREHPLEQAAREARAAQRQREIGESWKEDAGGGVAVMEPEVITVDPRTSPELAMDPRVAARVGAKPGSRVRPIEEINTSYRLRPQQEPQPQLQPLRTKMPMRTEVETVFQDEPRPPRRFPPGGPGGVGEQVQQMMNSPFVLPKHVVTLAALEGKVKKARDHGRPKLLRKNALGVIEELSAGLFEDDSGNGRNENLQLANATDSNRLVSSTSDS